jgi:TRAP-type C4-dicarboxylate transport system permease small subunit
VTDEISGYLLALAATWGFAFALRTGGHVRVDVSSRTGAASEDRWTS